MNNLQIRVTIVLAFCCAAGLFAEARELAPEQLLSADAGQGFGRAVYSERTLVVGLVVDRDGARLSAHTVKERPFIADLDRDKPHADDASDAIHLEVVLLGPDGLRFTQRVDARGLCLEHDPESEDHLDEGDNPVLHRDAFLVQLPELSGFDRIEIGYYSGSTTKDRSLERRSLGETVLGLSQSPSLSPAQIGPGGISGGPGGTPGCGATVIWPDADEPLYAVIAGDANATDGRINIVILPDGYRRSEKAQMETDAQAMVARMRDVTPYKEHDQFFNYFLVYAYSVESENDECDSCDLVNNAMGTYFGTGTCNVSGSRCIKIGTGTCDNGKGCPVTGLDNIVAAEMRAPDLDFTALMVNTARHGGCRRGATRVTLAAHSLDDDQEVLGPDTFVHELSHAIGDLADEYTAEGCGSYAGEINTSLYPTVGAWPEWIDEIGPPWKGGERKRDCVWRPERYCQMSRPWVPFCKVCAQRLSLVVYDHPGISPIGGWSPASCSRVDLNTPVTFDVTTRLPSDGAESSIVWKLDGVQIAMDVDSYTTTFESEDDHTMTCEVTADTNFVKLDPPGPTREVVTWEFTAADSLSADCNGNLKPDWCEEPDCNGNLIPDGCENLPDCNDNDFPDVCDIAEGTSSDCNMNGVPDLCDIAQGTSSDCNTNRVPDECDIAQGTSPDCNTNQVPDECDVAEGDDCNTNNTPDSCEPDFNPNCTLGEVCSPVIEDCVPLCPASHECGPGCYEASPPDCSTVDTHLTVCSETLDGTELLSCDPGKSVIVSNCACDSDPGFICLNESQRYFCN